MVEIVPVDEFLNDMRKLMKKFRCIEDDLEVFKKVLGTPPQIRVIGQVKGQIQGAERISGLGARVKVPIFKAKRFYTKDLHSTDEIRVIYAYEEEKAKYTLIEIYFKGDKDNEDRNRIFKYFG